MPGTKRINTSCRLARYKQLGGGGGGGGGGGINAMGLVYTITSVLVATLKMLQKCGKAWVGGYRCDSGR